MLNIVRRDSFWLSFSVATVVWDTFDVRIYIYHRHASQSSVNE